MKESNIKNKYNIRMSNMPLLKANNSKIAESKLFDINDYDYCGDSYWELTKYTYKNDAERLSRVYSYFTIQIDDDDNVMVTCVSNSGFNFYHFEEFFNEDTIGDEIDLKLQEILLETLNSLLDDGVIYFPRCLGVECEYYTTHDYMQSITMCALTSEYVKQGVACTLREDANHYSDVVKGRLKRLESIRSKQ